MKVLYASVIAGGCGLLMWALTAAGATALTATRVATGLSSPVFVVAPPGDTERLFILEQHTGRIKILNLNTNTINATPFLDINGLTTGDEQGLLGLAFAPDYDETGRFYVNYTVSGGGLGGTTRVARGTVSANPDIANTTLTTILSFSQPFSNHNGGWMAFGPFDDYLYISTGDGGSAGDPGDRAQDITNQLLGKMLRIDVSSTGYTSPPDNPFVGTNGEDEIWAYGLRNPWRCSFDRVTGDLYYGDVGQGSWEEIDFEPALTGGVNYGWRCREGAHFFGSSTTNPCGSCLDPDCPLTDPIHEYARGGSPFRCAITGGEVYRGCRIPDLQGTYFYADYCSNQIWSFRYDADTGVVMEFAERTDELDPVVGTITDITSFGTDAAGEIYICDRGGQVYKIVPLRQQAYGEDCDRNGVLDVCESDCVSTAFCPHVDVNCDNVVNGLDVAAISNSANFGSAPCDALSLRADVNGDLTINGLDIAAASSSDCFGR